ncbi:hypothetical protein [Candidatus Chlorohelix sp.]|uniref:hypothetical protein n=1 Tax=Candidatus Chlorohelix sp. TaxID=3139201 RepID=UPI0030664D82
MGFFNLEEPELNDSESWADATEAFKRGIIIARQWQPDARTALTEIADYPPAHLNEKKSWEIFFWSPKAIKGLVLYLDTEYNLLNQNEWGVFYRESVIKIGQELLAPYHYGFAEDVSQPGPEQFSFVFRRTIIGAQTCFVDVQISTTVMLTPPPRRFTINLVKNAGESPLFGSSGGFETRLSNLIPGTKPDYWWSFRNESEYEKQLREAFGSFLKYGLNIMEQ